MEPTINILQGPRLSSLSRETTTEREEVSFEHWNFEVRSCQWIYQEAALHSGFMRSLHGTSADFGRYLGTQATMSYVIQKHELVNGTMASFDVLMQNFTICSRVWQKVKGYVTKLERALDAVHREHPHRLMRVQIKCHLREILFHNLKKVLKNSL